jgi:hypothetical protein
MFRFYGIHSFQYFKNSFIGRAKVGQAEPFAISIYPLGLVNEQSIIRSVIIVLLAIKNIEIVKLNVLDPI